MKTKIIFGLLSFLLAIFIILLFIPEDKTFKVITSPKVFSLLQSSENEDIKIEFLVNKNDTYYFDLEYISKISLNSDLDEEIFPLNIEEVNYGNGIYEYKNDKYYLLEIFLSFAFESDDYSIEFEKAFLDISYNNQEELKLYIGEFNYRFNSSFNDEVTISNLSSTVYENKGINTVSGIYIELYNVSSENLVITNFELASSSVNFNDFYLTEIFNEPDLFDRIEDILGMEEYDFNRKDIELDKSILLRENMGVMLYVPLIYLGDIDYLHRFYFEVTYSNNQGENTLIIDDIPYVSTSIFQRSLEEEYIVYEILD